MATIKAYTDIEQSRKLAEILPFESADMVWEYQKDKFVGEPDYLDNPQFGYVIDKRDIACWSLAALLGRLPFPVLYMEMVAGMIFWCCECNFIETDEMFKIEHYDNPIDACVAMIEKLHELKML